MFPTFLLARGSQEAKPRCQVQSASACAGRSRSHVAEAVDTSRGGVAGQGQPGSLGTHIPVAEKGKLKTRVMWQRQVSALGQAALTLDGGWTDPPAESWLLGAPGLGLGGLRLMRRGRQGPEGGTGSTGFARCLGGEDQAGRALGGGPTVLVQTCQVRMPGYWKLEAKTCEL